MNTVNNKELLVVKVGSNTIQDQMSEMMQLDRESIEQIGLQIAHIALRGDTDIALVSSGAGVAGFELSETSVGAARGASILERQFMSCKGQPTLIQEWDDALQGIDVIQVLATRESVEQFEGNDLKNVTNYCFDQGVIPIINENDAQAHEEIVFGDNDKLAAEYIAMLHKTGHYTQSRLVILSDIHGVYEDPEDPRTVIPVIDDIGAYTHVAGGPGSAASKGGMKSKFEAAEICTSAGVHMYIAYGRAANAIEGALAQDVGTHFPARQITHLQ